MIVCRNVCENCMSVVVCEFECKVVLEYKCVYENEVI